MKYGSINFAAWGVVPASLSSFASFKTCEWLRKCTRAPEQPRSSLVFSSLPLQGMVSEKKGNVNELNLKDGQMISTHVERSFQQEHFPCKVDCSSSQCAEVNSLRDPPPRIMASVPNYAADPGSFDPINQGLHRLPGAIVN